MSSYYDFGEYLTVAQKKKNNAGLLKRLLKIDKNLKPVILEGTKITKTFWGKAWCDNVESYQDYANRLPRGRSYVRCGAVVDLQITSGKISAIVAGSSRSPYEVSVEIAPLEPTRWVTLKKKCVGKVTSLLDLVQGKLPQEILSEFCNPVSGLFPSPKEIKTDCSCPDWANLCKHLAATFYAVGARLDEDPKLFFLLRGIDETELISETVVDTLTEGLTSDIASDDLSSVFGVDFDSFDDIKSTPQKAGTGKKAKKTDSPKEQTLRPIQTKKTERIITPLKSKSDKKQKDIQSPPPAQYKKELPKKPLQKKYTWTAKRILKLRNNLRLSQEKFAQVLKVSIGSISKWEQGYGAPSEVNQLKLAKLRDKS